MPKLPRWTAPEAEKALLAADFHLLRSKGSHRIYGKGTRRVVVPFHAGTVLHPKIVKQTLEAIEETRTE
jgi:predicted RNA binding protein YcfA (HicA-like mRNA interferase family)